MYSPQRNNVVSLKVRRQAHFLGWRRDVERVSVGLGARPLLGAVPETDWCEYFRADEAAFDVVVNQLIRAD